MFFVLYPFVTYLLTLPPTSCTNATDWMTGKLGFDYKRYFSSTQRPDWLWGQLTNQDLLLGDNSSTTTSGVHHVGIF
jgi:hypothetical protein